MRRFLVAVVVLGVALGSLSAFVLRWGDNEPRASVPRGAYRGSEPPGGIRLPSFTLRSYRGVNVSTRALADKVVLITFLDTKCTDKCPILASQVAAGLRRLPRDQRRRVAAIAISVNPIIDSPASIRRFLRRQRALSELDFLRGSLAEMRPVWNAFHILSAYETGNADVHSADIRVFDRRGEWVSTLHAGIDLTPANLARDIGTALGDEQP
jgi:cytochrome oxidase Cu insertion factor (SCO1/SenC/PrrC family)